MISQTTKTSKTFFGRIIKNFEENQSFSDGDRKTNKIIRLFWLDTEKPLKTEGEFDKIKLRPMRTGGLAYDNQTEVFG